MEIKINKLNPRLSCKIPRKKIAIEALLSLSWRKCKKQRPKWILEELKSIGWKIVYRVRVLINAL